MRILLTGASGFIGKSLLRELALSGHELHLVSRDPRALSEAYPYAKRCLSWNDLSPLSGIDAVIHLAGESVAGGRWSQARKQEIFDSRTKLTKQLMQAIAAAGEAGPKIFLSASAIGIYGDRGDETLTEDSKPGEDFLAKVCVAWEDASENSLGLRVVHFRIGMVLGLGGGALEKLVPIFGLGLGGPVGNGKQWMSWVHRRDVVRAIQMALDTPSIQGAYNLTAPHPVRNSEFTKALAHAFRKPAILPVPAFGLRILYGEMADIILVSQKVLPARLLASGFRFDYDSIDSAFKDLYPEGFEEEFFSEQWVSENPEDVFPFFSNAYNLEKITPPWLNFHIKKISAEKIQAGTLIDYRLRLNGIPMGWRTLIEKWEPIKEFVDTQLKGPYKKWHHTHTFISLNGGTLLLDRVRYKLPFGALGALLAGWKVKRQVKEIFAYRQKVIRTNWPL